MDFIFPNWNRCAAVSFSVALAGAALFGQSGVSGAASSFPTPSAITRGSSRSVLGPALDYPVSARAAGIVETIHVADGSRVEAGQLVMSLDSDQERAEVAQAKAGLSGAKAEMERANAEFDRVQSLREDNIYSEKQIAEAKAQAEVARARVAQAGAGLEGALVRLANRSINSPISGIFFKPSKLVGEAVERYETVARVVDVTSLEMVVFCDARYFSLFKIDQQVEVKVLRSPDDEPVVPGIVIYTDPIIDPLSSTFRVKIKIEPSAQAISGLPARLITPATQPISPLR